jgi:hypothetical protein
MLLLFIQGCKVKDQAAIHLFNGIRGNHNLITLDLSNNQIGNSGILELEKAIRELDTLSTIHLKGKNLLISRDGL